MFCVMHNIVCYGKTVSFFLELLFKMNRMNDQQNASKLFEATFIRFRCEKILDKPVSFLLTF